MNSSTLIVGYGNVGKNLERELNDLNPDIADIKIDGIYKKKNYSSYDVIFVCVDTPYVSKDNPCDISQVRVVLSEYRCLLKPDGVFVIKSTILPGTTQKLTQKLNVRIVFSPEYYGTTHHCNNFKFDFTILGGRKIDCIKVYNIISCCYDGRHKYKITNSTTAELTKYMENAWIATKVSFCNQFYDIATKHGVYYEDLRELFLLDERVSPAHTIVYRNSPYWDSHCLNKDVPAIAETEDAELLRSVVKFNDKRKPKD